MAAIPLIIPALTTDDGTPVSGALIVFKKKGTATNQVAYLDEALTIPSQNPEPCDAGGRQVCYLDGSLSYDITVKSADSAITYLSVTYSANSETLDLGSGWTDHLSKPLPFFFAADYGVSADNSAGVNYTAIEALIDAIDAAGPCRVIWPDGFIYTTGPHTLNSSYQRHSGSGAKITVVLTTQANILFTLGNAATVTAEYYFDNMGFGTPAGGTGIKTLYTQNVYITNFYENCDTWLHIGDQAAAGPSYRIHQENGEGAQVASSTNLSHIKHVWNLGEYKKINVNIEGQRQVSTVGENFSLQKAGVNIDGIEILGGYMGRFDINHDKGETPFANANIIGINAEGGGTHAWKESSSSANGGGSLCKFIGNTFGTDVADGSWAATPGAPVYIYGNHASLLYDSYIWDNTTITSVSKKTCFYWEMAAGAADVCRVGSILFRGVMADASQFLSHIKGAASGGATFTRFSHGPATGHSFTNALAGGVKYEGMMNASVPDAGAVAAGVPYFVDATDASTPVSLTSSTMATGDRVRIEDVSAGVSKIGTLQNLADYLGVIVNAVPLAKGATKQAFRVTITNTAGTLQHKITGKGDNTSAGNADYIAKLVSPSTSLQNTPTATDSSTAFVGGLKIASGDPSRMIFNMSAAQTTNLGLAEYQITTNTIGVDVVLDIGYQSANVNGVTQNRLVAYLRRTSDGADFSWDTTNIPSGKTIAFDVDCYAL